MPYKFVMISKFIISKKSLFHRKIMDNLQKGYIYKIKIFSVISEDLKNGIKFKNEPKITYS